MVFLALVARVGAAEEDRATSLTMRSLAVARYGDGVNSLARRYGMSVEALMELNRGLRPWGLHEGDAVVVRQNLLAPPELPLARQIRRGPRGRKQIALTFDAAWTSRAQLEQLIAVLEKYRAPASFFLTGIFLDKVPDGLQILLEHGYPIFNHTAKHPHLTTCDNARIERELLDVEKRVAAAASVSDEATLSTRPYWRPPFGESDARVRRVAANVGFQSIYWTIDSLDWTKEPPATVDSIFKRVCIDPFENATEHDPDPLDGAIVLFHVDGAVTPEAVDRIIPWLRSRGYHLVDLPTLLRP